MFHKLCNMQRISLEESKKIKIFKRFESKYILWEDYVIDFIKLLEKDYFLVVDNRQDFSCYSFQGYNYNS